MKSDPMQERVERRVYLGIVVALSVLGLIAYASYQGNNLIGEHLAEVTRTQQLVGELNDLLILVTDMETSERGFVITGDSTFLAPYEDSKQRIDQQLTNFYGLIRDEQARAYMDSLRIRVYRKFEIMENTIQVRGDNGFVAAMGIIESRVGMEAMTDIRQVVRYMQQLETELLNENLELADASFRRSSLIIVAETALAMVLILIASMMLFRDIRARKRVEASLRIERAQMESLIRNAPIPMMMIGEDMRILTYSSKFPQDFEPVAALGGAIGFNKAFPDLYQRFRDGFRKASDGEDVVNPEDTIVLGNGRERHISWMIHPIPGADGESRFIVVAYRIDELVEARQRAVEASEAKSSFLARISHELRTPLNAVLGYAQILQKSQTMAEQEKQYVGTMYRSGHHLLNMINDILDISKIESGKMDLVEADFNLPELLQDLQSMFNLKCADKGIELKTDFQEPLPAAVTGDPNKVRQVLINLLGNAIKFTKAGSVTLRMRYTGDYDITFEVEDTGPGIPADHLTLIWDPFQQVKGKYQEGTGLGLAISKRLAELMGGSIGVESTVGVGSLFRVRLPLKASAALLSGSRVHPRTAKSIKGGVSPRVLVVDDVEPNRDVARILLQMVGFTVDDAVNGKEAVDRFAEKPYDLVLMDIMMPVMDGVAAMLAIRATPEGKDTPIIALTASGFEGKNVELKRQGFTEYVRKPFHEPDLLELIGKLLGIDYDYEDSDTKSEVSEIGVDDIVAVLSTLGASEREAMRVAMEEQDFDQMETLLNELDGDHLARRVFEHLRGIAQRSDYYQLTMIVKRLNDV